MLVLGDTRIRKILEDPEGKGDAEPPDKNETMTVLGDTNIRKIVEGQEGEPQPIGETGAVSDDSKIREFLRQVDQPSDENKPDTMIVLGDTQLRNSLSEETTEQEEPEPRPVPEEEKPPGEMVGDAAFQKFRPVEPRSRRPWAVVAVALIGLGVGAYFYFTGGTTKRNPRDLLLAGNRKYETGRFKEAVGLYSEALEIDSKFKEALFNRGMSHFEMGDLAAAARDYTDAISLDPRFKKAHLQRALVRVRRKELDKAENDLAEAIKIDPTYADAYFNRGLLRLHKDQYEGAIADFGKVIELDPKDARAYHNRAVVHRWMGNVDRALADYAEAVKLDPGASATYLNRARLYAELDRWNDALKDWQALLRIDKHREQYLKARIDWARLLIVQRAWSHF